MTLEELMAQLGEGADSFRDPIQAYTDGITAGANARISQLEASNAELSKQLQQTQAENYRLMVAATAPQEPAGGDGEETPEHIDIRSLIKSGSK